jgi:hypothetical protein
MSRNFDPEVLNCGVALATAFGKDWLRPIQERLSQRYPSLTLAELDEYDETCRGAMKVAHALVPKVLVQSGGFNAQAYPEFRERLSRRYPWMSEDNAQRLFSQGCYYAMK